MNSNPEIPAAVREQLRGAYDAMTALLWEIPTVGTMEKRLAAGIYPGKWRGR